MLQESELSQQPINATAKLNQNGDLLINNDMRESLEKALQLHSRKTGDKPEDVIILQVTDREKNETSDDYQSNSEDKDHEKSRSQDGAGKKSNNQVNKLNVM